MGKEESDDMGAPTKKTGMTRFKARTILCNTAKKSNTAARTKHRGYVIFKGQSGMGRLSAARQTLLQGFRFDFAEKFNPSRLLNHSSA
jgi:hypothetical protein